LFLIPSQEIRFRHGRKSFAIVTFYFDVQIQEYSSPGYTMHQDLNQENSNYISNVYEEWHRKIHALLMFVPAHIFQLGLFLRKQIFNYATSVRKYLSFLLILSHN